MSRFDDYPGDMFATTVTDEDIELLLAGSAPANQELAELAVFVELIRGASAQVPSESQIVDVASEAAGIARSVGARQKARSRTRLSWRSRPQVALTLGAVLVTFAFAGVAAASNNAAPGDALYAIDLALERVGIGAGHVEERLEEANSLLLSGKTRLALAHAAQAIDLSAEDSGEAAALEEAKAALIEAAELIDVGQGTDALLVHENVSALLVFINDNHHQGTDLDGREFGRRVAALAREISTQHATTGPPDEVELDQPEDPGPPANVGEPAKSNPGPPVSVPRVESPPANNSGGGNSEPEERGETGKPTGNTTPGSNQGGSGGKGGPPPGSPSETAPGKGKP